jgi:hypothetical protein
VRSAPLVAGNTRGRLAGRDNRRSDVVCRARVKTAGHHHIQNAYRKIGVSTRAAATLFAMEHGLLAWGELPIARPEDRS